MSGIPKNRPSKKWLMDQIATGKSRSDIANACGAVNNSVTRWCREYAIEGVGRWNRPEDVTCGKATVVALITEDGDPEQYAIPGGDICSDRNEALKIAGRMNLLMTGRASDG